MLACLRAEPFSSSICGTIFRPNLWNHVPPQSVEPFSGPMCGTIFRPNLWNHFVPQVVEPFSAPIGGTICRPNMRNHFPPHSVEPSRRHTYFTKVCGTQEGRHRAGIRILRWFVAPRRAGIGLFVLPSRAVARVAGHLNIARGTLFKARFGRTSRTKRQFLSKILKRPPRNENGGALKRHIC